MVQSPDVSVLPGFEPYKGVDSPFMEWLGPLFVKRQEDEVLFAFRPDHNHSNGRSIHGGVLLSLADQILGLTLRERYGASATITLNTDFAASVAVGVWIIGTAELVRETRSLLFVRGRLWTEKGTILTASGIWKRLS